MRRISYIVLALMVTTISANAALKDDVNGDGKVNVSDLSVLSQTILESSYTSVCDLNQDGKVDVTDLSLLVGYILDGTSEETPSKLVGGDISMLPKYEEHGAIYYDQNGNQVTDMLAFYKSIGHNAMRVRLFVDPSNDSDSAVIQDVAFVSKLGKNIKDHGLQFMLDYHYSDTWADPGKQNLPAAWKDCTPAQLADSVYAFTKASLETLVAAGATPDLVQVGNEITCGMLWPSGHCHPDGADYDDGGTWTNFANYFNAGAKAVREVVPNAKVICHVELSSLNTPVEYFTTAKKYNLDYDIIGLSYYPAYHATSDDNTISDIEGVVQSIETNFPDRKVMITETGYSYQWPLNGTRWNYYGTKYAYSEEGQASFTADLVAMLNQHACVTGLFWWWPEQNEYGLDYSTKRVTDSWSNSSLVDSRTGKILQGTYNLGSFAR